MAEIDQQVFEAPKRLPSHGEYLRLLIRHGWLLVFVITLTILLTYLGRASQPLVYEADLTVDLNPASTPAADFVATQMRSLSSEANVRAVAAEFHIPVETPAENVPLIQGLEVRGEQGSPLVHVRYRSVDEKLAADVVNGIFQSYLSQGKREQTSRPVEAVPTDDASRQEALAHAMVDRVTKETAYESLKAGNLAALLASPEGVALRQPVERRNELQRRLTDMRQTLGENHPDYLASLARLRQVNDEIASAKALAIDKAFTEMTQSRLREGNLRKELLKNKQPGTVLPAQAAAVTEASARVVSQRVEALPRGLGRTCILAGLITALPVGLLILLVGSTDARIREVSDLQASSSSYLLGVVPTVRSWTRSHAEVPRLLSGSGKATADESLYREAVESLRSSIEISLASKGAGNRSVAITGPVGGEGRSTLAANLAVSFAMHGKRVLLIDGDLRHPGLAVAFGSARPSSASSEPENWREQLIRPQTQPSLAVLALDPSIPARHVLAEAADEYDLILVDSPPFLHFPETVDLVNATDTVVLLVRAKRTSQAALTAVLGYLRRLDSQVLGTVLNGV